MAHKVLSDAQGEWISYGKIKHYRLSWRIGKQQYTSYIGEAEYVAFQYLICCKIEQRLAEVEEKRKQDEQAEQAAKVTP